jgi:hypothetical protein
MMSPPNSPSHNLQGASRTTGGIFRGRALGNVFNFADAANLEYQDCPVMGKVLVYTSHTINPSDTQSYMLLKHAVTPFLAPILRKLGERFPPLHGELYFFQL